MSRKIIVTLFFVAFLWSCRTENSIKDKSKYLRWVGDIEQNTELDDPDFTICGDENDVYQYFNLGQGPIYVGGKTKLLEAFRQKYKAPSNKDGQSGMIRIRFVVNCKGKAGRFRIIQSDYDYNEMKFEEQIISQLLSITKEIENWEILYKNDNPVDYYFYLIFKIKDGQIKEILP